MGEWDGLGWDGLRSDVDEGGRLLLEAMIVAVVRGRQEIGPRALGHRSLIGYRHDAAIVDFGGGEEGGRGGGSELSGAGSWHQSGAGSWH